MHALIFALASSLILTATPSDESASKERRRDGAWRLDLLWDDGMAEFSVYETSWSRYGRRYPGRTTLVLVKEPWAPKSDVKADRPGTDSFDVIKLNHIRDVRTGVYEYHQMASVFVRRDDGRLRKLAVMSSEACGLTTSDMTGGRLRTRSYFDGHADRSLPWPAAAAPADGLPLHLRDYVAGALPGKLDVFPSLMSGALPRLRPIACTLARRELKTHETEAGSFAAVELTLTSTEGKAVYVFEKASPHRLLSMHTMDGSSSRLVKSGRIPYWSMSAPGREAWLPEKLR